MTPRIIKRSYTIRELTGGGWINLTTGQKYKTAAQALKAVNRDAKSITKGIEEAAVVTVIEWEPTTGFGTAIVKAIAGNE